MAVKSFRQQEKAGASAIQSSVCFSTVFLLSIKVERGSLKLCLEVD